VRPALQIARARARCSGRGLSDPPAFHRRLESVLADGVTVPGLSRDAILCVRELLDPLPGGLDIAESLAIHWRRRLEERLAELARCAVRPAQEPGATGDVVLFADDREMLLCLARDLARGLVTDRWWWRILLREEPTRRLCTAWRERPEWVPPAIDVLAAERLALPLLQSLPGEHLGALVAALAARFALPALARALVQQRGEGSLMDEVDGKKPARDDPARPRSEADETTPPWSSWAPEVIDETPSAPAMLLLLALTLARAPTRARTPEFAAAVRAWRATVFDRKPGVLPGPSGAVEAAGDRGSSAPLPEAFRGDVVERPPDTQPAALAGAAARIAPTLSGEPSGATPQAEEEAPLDADLDTPVPAAATGEPGTGRAGAEAVIPRSAAPAPADPHTPAERPAACQPLRVSYPTDLGGLFFLLNVGFFLELYGDFTRPLSPGINLPPWEFVSMVGRWLLGETAPDTADDPAWAVLGRLTARPPEEPEGDGFVPDQDWRVPLAWLKPFPEPADCVWSADEHGVRLRHPAGFSLVELGADPTAADPAAARRRWLDNLGGYLRARLPRALGLADATSLPEVLLRVPALISIGDTRVDVSFSLASYPLAVRLAGLDRDPGWIPAAGRDVRFHFT
jgi:hypothetical protein